MIKKKKLVKRPIKANKLIKNIKKKFIKKIEQKTIDSDYFNIKELSEFLNLSISHIYTLTSTKKIPHIKLLGKKLLFDKQEIKNWLKSKSVSVK